MQAIHYSSKEIQPGSIITSAQSPSPTFNIVWPIYKQVADELGLYFPKAYGYAYVNRSLRSFEHKYIVEAPIEYVTYGDYDHSLFVVMDRCNELVPGYRKLPLEERLRQRAIKIREESFAYFNFTNIDPDHIEAISDRWIVLPK